MIHLNCFETTIPFLQMQSDRYTFAVFISEHRLCSTSSDIYVYKTPYQLPRVESLPFYSMFQK